MAVAAVFAAFLSGCLGLVEHVARPRPRPVAVKLPPVQAAANTRTDSQKTATALLRQALADTCDVYELNPTQLTCDTHSSNRMFGSRRWFGETRRFHARFSFEDPPRIRVAEDCVVFHPEPICSIKTDSSLEAHKLRNLLGRLLKPLQASATHTRSSTLSAKAWKLWRVPVFIPEPGSPRL